MGRRVSRTISGRRHISAKVRGVLRDRYGSGGPRRGRLQGNDVRSTRWFPTSGGWTMNRWILSLAAAAALGFTLAGTSLAQDQDAQGASGAPAILNSQQDEDNQGFSRYRGDDDPNYGRDWNRDQGGWGDRGRFYQVNLEGRWVADNRDTDFDRGGYGGYGDFHGRGPMRDVMLPSLIRIDQRPNMVRIANR